MRNLISLLEWNLFTEQEWKLIIIAFAVFVVLVIANVLLIYFYNKRHKRKLCNQQLQSKRDELLKELQNVKSNPQEDEEAVPIVMTFWKEKTDDDDVEEEVAETDLDEADDDDDADDDNAPVVLGAAAANEPFGTTIIAVRDMTKYMRRHFNLLDSSNDNKSFYAQCRYSFEAKLRSSDDAVKARYQVLRNELAHYKNVKVKNSFRQERIYLGRKTLGLIVFRGKTLCVALALNPADYADTKYRGIDKSDKKRFAKTPMLMKLTSDRKLRYVCYLLTQIAEANTIVMDENADNVLVNAVKLPLAELYERELVRIMLLDEADEVEASAPQEEQQYVEEAEEEPVETDEDEAGDDDDVDDDSDAPVTLDANAANEPFGTTIIAVRDMTKYMRRHFELLDSSNDDKRFYAQCRYSFEAKLRSSDDVMKSRYQVLRNELAHYKNVKVKNSFRQERIYLGRKTLGLIVFRGKTLCVALALNPADYADTKYRGIDKSDKKRFAKTPMLMKLTSDRKLRYLCYLIAQLAETNKIALQKEYSTVFVNAVQLPLAELYERELVRISLLGEVNEELEQNAAASVSVAEKFDEQEQPQDTTTTVAEPTLVEEEQPAEVEVELAKEQPVEEPVEQTEEEQAEVEQEAVEETVIEDEHPVKDTAEVEIDNGNQEPVFEEEPQQTEDPSEKTPADEEPVEEARLPEAEEATIEQDIAEEQPSEQEPEAVEEGKVESMTEDAVEEFVAEEPEPSVIEAGGEDSAELDDEQDEIADDEEVDDEQDDEDPASVQPQAVRNEGAEGSSIAVKIMPVSEMSGAMRKKFNLIGEENDGRRFNVQCRYGFEAKLRLSDEEIKQRYLLLRSEIARYDGMKVRGSFKQERIYVGKKTLGLILFNGKALCLAIALDPVDYAETKYRGIDKTGKKRFVDTPMLFKLTSERRAGYAKHLLARLADINGIALKTQPEKFSVDASAMSDYELFQRGLMRITLMDEVIDD